MANTKKLAPNISTTELSRMEHVELLANLEHATLKLNKDERRFLNEYLQNPYLKPSSVAKRVGIDPIKSVKFLQRPHVKNMLRILKYVAMDNVKTIVDVKLFLSEVIDGNVEDLMGPPTIDTKIRAAHLLVKLEDIETPITVEVTNPDVNVQLERSKYLIRELTKQIATHQGKEEAAKVLKSSIQQIKLLSSETIVVVED